MKQISDQKSELNAQILDFCRHIAGSSEIIAIAHVDNYSLKDVNDKTVIDIMLIIKSFQPRVMSYIKAIKGNYQWAGLSPDRGKSGQFPIINSRPVARKSRHV